jgi:uncharacterized membrane protein YhhN
MTGYGTACEALRFTKNHYSIGGTMLNTIIVIFAALLLAGLLYFEKTEDRKKMLPTKTVLSVLFIVAAWVQPHPVQTYSFFVVIGLICCLGGDVFLALPREKMFLFGLISFLIGHIFYVIAFISVANLNRLTWVGFILTLVVGMGIYRWLKPHLGSMKGPVICYIVVISIMLCGAWSILGMSRLAVSGRVVVFAGAVCFYVSDILVARDRFLKTEFFNRLVGLPLYYAGQFLIAFSIGVLA